MTFGHWFRSAHNYNPITLKPYARVSLSPASAWQAAWHDFFNGNNLSIYVFRCQFLMLLLLFLFQLVVSLLPYIQSSSNPVIYGFMSSKFRASLRRSCCLVSADVRQRAHATEMTSWRGTRTHASSKTKSTAAAAAAGRASMAFWPITIMMPSNEWIEWATLCFAKTQFMPKSSNILFHCRLRCCPAFHILLWKSVVAEQHYTLSVMWFVVIRYQIVSQSRLCFWWKFKNSYTGLNQGFNERQSPSMYR